MSGDKSDKKEGFEIERIDRRDFLKKMGMTAFGAVIGTSKLFKATEAAQRGINPVKIPKLPKGAYQKAWNNRSKYKRPRPVDAKKLMEEHKSDRVVLITDGLSSIEIQETVAEFKASSIPISTIDGMTLASTGLQCGVQYYGWVYVNNVDDIYWWAIRCSNGSTYNCKSSRPSESTYCDIHYESWMYFYDESFGSRGMINFPGCNPATNCGGTCGAVNTKKYGSCGLRYSDIPFGSSGFLVLGYYTLTKYSNGQCDHCDCYTASRWWLCDDYPQVMITDIRGF